MGKAIVNDFIPYDKQARYFYNHAYSHLREFYRECASGDFTDEQLMERKYYWWRVNGRYLDLAWEHHFARQVAIVTGKGLWSGWANVAREHTFLLKHPDPLYYGPMALPF